MTIKKNFGLLRLVIWVNQKMVFLLYIGQIQIYGLFHTIPSKRSLAEKKLLNFIENWLKNNKQSDIEGALEVVTSIKNTLRIRNK